MKSKKLRSRFQPRFDHLEDRTLMAVSLTGVPIWVDQGPGPVINGQVEGLVNNPVAGAIQAIATHPTQPDTVLIGSVNGGIWKTTNASNASPTWNPLIDDFPSLSITSITFSPRSAAGGVIFASIGASSSAGNKSGPLAGLLKSSDGGTVWRFVGAELRGLNIREVIALAGTGAEVVLAVTTAGLFRSTDAGQTFPSLVLEGNFTDIVADPINPNRVFAARQDAGGGSGGVFVSTNQGASWAQIDSGVEKIVSAQASNLKLATTGGFLYAAIVTGRSGTGAGGQLAGVFRTTNLGATWTQMETPGTVEPPFVGSFIGINPGGQGEKHFSFAIDPANPFVVYIGGDRQPFIPSSTGNTNFTGRLFRGDSSIPFGGGQWASITGLGASLSAPHADSRAMVFDALGNLLQADDGGIYRLKNPSGDVTKGLRQWQSAIGNLRITELNSAALDPVSNVILAGAQDTGSMEMIGGISSPDRRWRQAPLFSVFNQDLITAVGDGNIQAVDTLSAAPNTIRYSLGNNFDFFVRRTFNSSNVQVGLPEFIRLSSPTASLIPHSGLLAPDLGITTFAGGIRFVLNSVAPNRMIVGLNGVYESFNRGDVVTPIENTLLVPGTIPIGALAYGGRNADGTANPGVVYVARGAAVRLRPGDGQSFVNGPALPFGAGSILDLVLDPTNFRTAYVVTSADRIFRLDGVGLASQSVTEITGFINTLEAKTLLTIEIFRTPAGQRVILVGGRDGVYRTLDSDFASPTQDFTTWHEFGSGLAKARVTDLRFEPSRDVLLAATHGRGAWTISSASSVLAAPANLIVNPDTSVANQAITLRRNPAKPWQLQVFLNHTTAQSPDLTVPLASLQNITVNGGAGSDTLTVDNADGPINISGIFRFEAGSGPGAIDSLLFTNPLGENVISDTYIQRADGTSILSAMEFNKDDNFDGQLTRVFQSLFAFGVEAVRDTTNISRMVVDYSGPDLADSLTISNGATVGTTKLISNRFASLEVSSKDTLEVRGGDQNDTINVEGARVVTDIQGNGGNDTFNLGRATGAFGSASTLADITELVALHGGEGLNTLNVMSTASTLLGIPINLTGQLTFNRITGLQTGLLGITYDEVGVLNVALGGGDDVFYVPSTAAFTTTTVSTGGGDDTIRVGMSSTGAVGSLASIRGPLTVDGGSATFRTVADDDALFLDDFQDTANNTGALTNTTVSGLGLTGGALTYRNLEKLTVNLGSGSDTFTIASTHAGLTVLDMGSNRDFVNVQRTSGSLQISGGDGDDIIRLGSLAPAAGGTVNAINGLVTIKGGTNSTLGDSLFIDDTGDVTPNTGDVDTKVITGLGMAKGIQFSALEHIVINTGTENDTISLDPTLPSNLVTLNLDGGQKDGVIIRGTPGNDRIRVSRQVGVDGAELVVEMNGRRTIVGYQSGETIRVFGGRGNDEIILDDSAALRWRAEFFGEEGNDHLVGSLLDDLLDGGGGNDRLEGGAGADVMSGGSGNDQLRGGEGDDQLNGGSGHDMLRGEGGNDLLMGGAGLDYFFGGSGADLLSAHDGGQDLILVDLFDQLLAFDRKDWISRLK